MAATGLMPVSKKKRRRRKVPKTALTHHQLVHAASRWLRGHERCPIVLTEFTSAVKEIPDAIGWRRGGRISILIECKVSRSDFLRDKEKPHRKFGKIALGQERLYMAPMGLISVDELPRGWGLLEVSENGTRVYARHRTRPRRSRDVSGHELPLLFAAVMRFQLDPRIDGTNPLTLRQKGITP